MLRRYIVSTTISIIPAELDKWDWQIESKPRYKLNSTEQVLY